ncbi:MAG: ATP synthase protein I [Alphaproteobacteria bacterium]|jgi:ATP synthase protein I
MKAKQVKKPPTLSDQIGAKADRKANAKRRGEPGLWFGLGMMGLVGWSIAIPTLLGTALGLWLDRHFDDQRSWTLACLLAGLVIGCFTAWSWLSKEHKAIDDDDN